MIGLMIALLSLGIVSGQLAEIRIYALPVGQGDALVVQCPNRDVTIVDMGSSDGSSSGFWNKDAINEFMINISAKVKNIVITHNHRDHYNLIPQVFNSANKSEALKKIYISRTLDELPDDLYNWVEELGLASKVRTINDGKEYCCKPKDNSCHTIDLCPGVNAEVLFANLGCGVDANTNSIVIRITYNEFSMVLNGDFTDIPDRVCGREFTGENKVNLYKRMEDTTVYKLAHHGSSSGANKDKMLSVIKPKAIFVSANSWHGYGHPRCSIINFLINNQSLCKPKVQNQSDQFYCKHQFQDPGKNMLQEEYTCCYGPKNCMLISNNDYAIYSTAPTEDTINLIELVTDGTKWGFIKKPQIKSKSGHSGTIPSTTPRPSHNTTTSSSRPPPRSRQRSRPTSSPWSGPL